MKVECHYRNDTERGVMDPVLEPGSRRFVFRLYSGDICDPIHPGRNWFTPPFPENVWRAHCKLPILPFIAWRWPFLKRAGYIGFKLYGADAPAYKNWMDPAEVYDGSRAVCLSFRPFARLE